MSYSFPPPTVLTFGKYRGHDVTTVPVDYLIYFLKKAQKVPRVIMRELERRAQETGRDAVEANAALSRWRYELAHNSRDKPKPPKQPTKKKRSKRNSSQELHRQASHRAADKLKAGVDVVGKHFVRLREEFAATGGSLADSPFDTADGPYEGPASDYTGARPVVRPPEASPTFLDDPPRVLRGRRSDAKHDLTEALA